MGLWASLRSFFCGSLLSEIADLEEEHGHLIGKLVDCNNRYDDMLDQSLKCIQEKGALQEENLDLEADVRYFESRVRSLTEALGSAIVLPDLKTLVNLGDAVTVSPRDMSALDGYELMTADLEYYAFPLPVWEDVLTLVQAEVEKALTRYLHPVADCDDYALVMNSFMAIAMRQARFDMQSSLMIVWSQSHAYNAFIDVEGNVWLYEPQSNVIGDMLAEGEAPYDSRSIWFPHESVGMDNP